MSLPKDKVFLIKRDEQWHSCIWNEFRSKFIYARLDFDLYEGKWRYPYFEETQLDECQIKEWKEL